MEVAINNNKKTKNQKLSSILPHSDECLTSRIFSCLKSTFFSKFEVFFNLITIMPLKLWQSPNSKSVPSAFLKLY